jgi:putative transposase
VVVLDGGKALRAAVNSVFGHAPVQRCIGHEERNALDPLPERDRPAVKLRLRGLEAHSTTVPRLAAWRRSRASSRLAPRRGRTLRKGLAETVALQRLGPLPPLWKSLSSTYPSNR